MNEHDALHSIVLTLVKKGHVNRPLLVFVLTKFFSLRVGAILFLLTTSWF